VIRDPQARTYSAFVIGAVVAELLLNLNAFTNEWDYGDAEYVMHDLSRAPGVT
jgi:hypothetical protein